MLEIARRRGLADAQTCAAMRGELETIAKMISGLIRGLDRRQA